MKSKRNLSFGIIAILMTMIACNQTGKKDEATNEITIKPGYPLLKDQVKLENDLMLNRAIELFLWGLPVNQSYTDRDALFTASGGGFQDVIYVGGFSDHTKKLSTLNNETVYATVLLDLQDGPIVYDAPAMDAKGYLFGSIIDLWQVALTDVGVPQVTPDAGNGGKYLIIPPGFNGEIPKGYFEIQSPTNQVTLGLRSVMLGDASLDDAIARVKQVKIYPLSNPEKVQNYIDILDKPLNAEIDKGIGAYKYLHDYLSKEPIEEKDKYLVGMLASLGIEKGKPFPADEETLNLIKRGAELGWMTAKLNATKSWEPSLLNGWLTLGNADSWVANYITKDMVLADRRAAYFTIAIWPPKNMGTSTYYSIVFKDKDDRPLEKGKNYKLHLPANVPVNSFWSVILYDAETYAMIENSEEKYTVNSLMKDLKINEDGSVDVYFGPVAPEGKEANWIPTTDNDFFVGFRFYSPDWDRLGISWNCDRPELLN